MDKFASVFCVCLELLVCIFNAHQIEMCHKNTILHLRCMCNSSGSPNPLELNGCIFHYFAPTSSDPDTEQSTQSCPGKALNNHVLKFCQKFFAVLLRKFHSYRCGWKCAMFVVKLVSLVGKLNCNTREEFRFGWYFCDSGEICVCERVVVSRKIWPHASCIWICGRSTFLLLAHDEKSSLEYFMHRQSSVIFICLLRPTQVYVSWTNTLFVAILSCLLPSDHLIILQIKL